MVVESVSSIYSRNIQSVMRTDLVPTYMVLRNEYDPIPFKGDISSFSGGIDLLNDKPVDFEIMTFVGRHMATLSIIADFYKKIESIDCESCVSFRPGTENWENDVLSSVRSTYNKMLSGEGVIIEGDYLESEVEPAYSVNSVLKAVNPYLTKAKAGKLKNSLSANTPENDWNSELRQVIVAKDLLMRILFQSYFETVRSRTHGIGI